MTDLGPTLNIPCVESWYEIGFKAGRKVQKYEQIGKELTNCIIKDILLKTLYKYSKLSISEVEIQKLRTEYGYTGGRLVWNIIQNNIPITHTSRIKELKFNESLKELYIKTSQLIHDYNMIENEYINKSNHFFMQLQNLVSVKTTEYSIELNRIVQLGFNAGQLSIFIEKSLIDEKIIECIKENKMLDLNTYVNLETQNRINSILNPLDGGSNNYHSKYIKYKNKYIKLKRN
jgi:hypothetical protein